VYIFLRGGGIGMAIPVRISFNIDGGYLIDSNVAKKVTRFL